MPAVMRIIGFMVSRYKLYKAGRGEETPGMRIANDIDFFRNDEADPCFPDGLDDCDLNRITYALMKAFLDMKIERVNCRARWGSSTFQGGPTRVVTDNPKNKGQVRPEDCFKPTEGRTVEDREKD